MTNIATGEGWSDLAVLLDLFSRRVVGWVMSAANDRELALAALKRVVAGRRAIPSHLVHHTDRASPYASRGESRALDEHGMIPSMSRKGDCWDKAVSESFSATLRAELVDHEAYATRHEAATAIGQYIESFYNAERLHSHLDDLSPIEFEWMAHLAAIAA